MRHSPNLRNTERGRPQRRQRVYPRVLYFGVRCWRTRNEVLAIAVPLASVRRRAGRPAAVSREWHPEQLEQRERLLVGSRARGDRDVESPDLIDLVVVDLREDDLLLDAHVVVAAAVEGARRQAAEVADPRDRYRQQAVEELVGALAAQ